MSEVVSSVGEDVGGIAGVVGACRRWHVGDAMLYSISTTSEFNRWGQGAGSAMGWAAPSATTDGQGRD